MSNVRRAWFIRAPPGNDEPMHGCAGQHGFTLAETLIASVVLAFAVIAVSQMIVAGQMATYEALHHRRGQSLAEAMIEEILSLPYADLEGELTLGPDSGETARHLYDNMDDYHGFAEAAGDAADFAGTAYPDTFDTFRRAVSISSDSRTISGFSAALTGLEITVTVTDERGQEWRIVRFVPEPSS